MLELGTSEFDIGILPFMMEQKVNIFELFEATTDDIIYEVLPIFCNFCKEDKDLEWIKSTASSLINQLNECIPTLGSERAELEYRLWFSIISISNTLECVGIDIEDVIKLQINTMVKKNFSKQFNYLKHIQSDEHEQMFENTYTDSYLLQTACKYFKDSRSNLLLNEYDNLLSDLDKRSVYLLTTKHLVINSDIFINTLNAENAKNLTLNQQMHAIGNYYRGHLAQTQYDTKLSDSEQAEQAIQNINNKLIVLPDWTLIKSQIDTLIFLDSFCFYDDPTALHTELLKVLTLIESKIDYEPLPQLEP